MADTNTDTDAPAGFAPISLLAASYNLADLEQASVHAEGLKTGAGREAAFARLPADTALNQDVIEAWNTPAVPEGTELAEIEDAAGRTVIAPVAIPMTDDEPEKASPPSRRRASPPTDTPPTDGSGGETDTGNADANAS